VESHRGFSLFISATCFNLIHTGAQKRHVNVFLSLSAAINGRSSNHKKLITAASPDRLLVESDYHDIRYSTPYTIKILRTVAELKGWEIEEEWIENLAESEWGAVRKLEANWNAFTAARHIRPTQTSSRNRRFDQDWVSEDESE